MTSVENDLAAWGLKGQMKGFGCVNIDNTTGECLDSIGTPTSGGGMIPFPASSCVYGFESACQYGGASSTANLPGGTGVGAPNFWTALSTSLKGATSILGTRYAVPQLNPGQLIQTGPNGQSLMYQGTSGNMSLPSGLNLSAFTSGGSSNILLIAGVAAVALFMFKK